MDHPETPRSAQATPSRRWFAGAAALGGLGLFAAGAQAQGAGLMGMGHHRGMMDPEALAKRMDERISRLIKNINGTAEQKDKLLAIAQATLADLKPLRAQHLAARLKGVDLLGAASIDVAALEQLRVAQMQAADATSQRVVRALIDAAEILSPSQRAQLADRMKQRLAKRAGAAA